MPDYDLTTVIEDSLTDASLPAEPTTNDVPEVEATPDPAVETPSEPILEAQEAVVEAAAEPAQTEAEKKSRSKVFDDFDKKFGLEATYPNSGRENRIPYSRVKKIAQKAVRDARKEWEAETTPKSQEYETKVKSYEERLARVDQFEKVMVNNPDQFLEMLSTLPAYKQFFAAIEDAFTKAQAPQTQTQVQETQQVGDDMPQPDVQYPDGSLVYSEKQLRALNAWNREQAKKETLEEVNRRFAPIESEWQAQKRIDALKPAVTAQINEARTWKGFTENEAEIVKVLQTDPRISLEGAYRKVVMPKLEAQWEAEKQRLVPDRNKIREELLQELRNAPKSTAVTTSATKASPVSEGPKTLEQIIAEQIKTLK